MNAQFIKLTRDGANNENMVMVHMRHVCRERKGQPYSTQFSLQVTVNEAGGSHDCGCHTFVPIRTWMRWYHRHNFARRLEGQL